MRLVSLFCLGNAVYLLNEGSKRGWCRESSQTWAKVMVPWENSHSFYKAMFNQGTGC